MERVNDENQEKLWRFLLILQKKCVLETESDTFRSNDMICSVQYTLLFS